MNVTDALRRLREFDDDPDTGDIFDPDDFDDGIDPDDTGDRDGGCDDCPDGQCPYSDPYYQGDDGP